MVRAGIGLIHSKLVVHQAVWFETEKLDGLA